MSRVGEKNRAKNGLMMEIITYRNSYDIDIRFEDNEIVYHRRYEQFKNGCIKHPTITMKHSNRSKRIGETNVAANGQTMTIIEYRGACDIDIQFDDEDNTIVHHKAYKEFKKGYILNPNTGKTVHKTNYQTESVHLLTGQKMHLVKYNTVANVIVKFEDGEQVKTEYERFINGTVVHPNSDEFKYVGLTNIHKNTGMKMEIVGYRRHNDIDVLFSDGVLVEHRNLMHFRKGTIGHPTYTKETVRINKNAKLYEGKTYDMMCGLQATVIEYICYNDVTLRFSDGRIKEHANIANIRKGKVGPPTVINEIAIGEFAYVYDGDWYYECSHPDWHYRKILSVQEMYDYVA